MHRVITWNAGDLNVSFNVAQEVRDTGMKTEGFLKVPDPDIWHVFAGRVVPHFLKFRIAFCRCQAVIIALKMKELRSLGTWRTAHAIAQLHISEDLQQNNCENLKYHLKLIKFWWPVLNSLQTFNEGTVSSVAHSTCIFRFSPHISMRGCYKCGCSSFSHPSTFQQSGEPWV